MGPESNEIIHSAKIYGDMKVRHCHKVGKVKAYVLPPTFDID